MTASTFLGVAIFVVSSFGSACDVLGICDVFFAAVLSVSHFSAGITLRLHGQDVPRRRFVRPERGFFPTAPFSHITFLPSLKYGI